MTTTTVNRRKINGYPHQERGEKGKVTRKAGLTYAESGVDMRKEDIAMKRIIPIFEKTFSYRKGVGKSVAKIGHFAGLVQLNRRMGNYRY